MATQDGYLDLKMAKSPIKGMNQVQLGSKLWVKGGPPDLQERVSFVQVLWSRPLPPPFEPQTKAQKRSAKTVIKL